MIEFAQTRVFWLAVFLYCISIYRQMPLTVLNGVFFFQAEDGRRDAQESRGLGDVYKRQECGHCRDHCPYGLDTPALLKRNLADYRAFLESELSLIHI